MSARSIRRNSSSSSISRSSSATPTLAIIESRIRQAEPYPGLPVLLTCRAAEQTGRVVDAGDFPAQSPCAGGLIEHSSGRTCLNRSLMKSTQEITREVQELGAMDSRAARASRPCRHRAKIPRRSAVARPAREWPHPARRRAGPGENADGQNDGGRDPDRLSAAAIHARSAARRFDRDADLQSAQRRVHDQARPALFQPDPGRRNQPRAGESAERACSKRCRSGRSRSATQTYPLSDPFLVLATQNPLEQEGTYQLPEAQLDRFMLKLNVGYPTKAEERRILDLMATSAPNLSVSPVVDPAADHRRARRREQHLHR